MHTTVFFLILTNVQSTSCIHQLHFFFDVRTRYEKHYSAGTGKCLLHKAVKKKNVIYYQNMCVSVAIKEFPQHPFLNTMQMNSRAEHLTEEYVHVKKKSI